MFFSGGLIPLYLLIMQLGLINNMWALLLPGAINVWNMFILRTSFQQIPEELYEAALIDGANDLQTLIRIALPLSKAVLATLLMFYAVAHWNDFFNALIFLNNRAKYPIQLIMRNIVILGHFGRQISAGRRLRFRRDRANASMHNHHGVDDPDPVGLSVRAEVLRQGVS